MTLLLTNHSTKEKSLVIMLNLVLQLIGYIGFSDQNEIYIDQNKIYIDQNKIYTDQKEICTDQNEILFLELNNRKEKLIMIHRYMKVLK